MKKHIAAALKLCECFIINSMTPEGQLLCQQFPSSLSDQEAWMSSFQDCSGKSQSPIDIETSKAIYDPSLPLIELDGYDLTGGPHLTLLNNGHTRKLVVFSARAFQS